MSGISEWPPLVFAGAALSGNWELLHGEWVPSDEKTRQQWRRINEKPWPVPPLLVVLK